ncbi:MAG: hypothetical protein WC455_24035 [Dehalococcoidia bacterium]|jgi:hypothetical protein
MSKKFKADGTLGREEFRGQEFIYKACDSSMLSTTVDQWQEALSATVVPKFPNAKTLTELSKELGIKRSTLQGRLRNAMLAGTCRAFRDIRNNRETTVYELVEKGT